ncbi:MAG TPA: hypothetical protein VFZ78_05775 [Flavisolibacter sp.]
MKTIISFVALSAMILTSSFTINVQENLNKQSTQNCFDYFRAHRAGKAAVAMMWGVSANDIVQFAVERSYDGSYFEPAGTVAFNGAAGYKFTDNSIYPGYLHYRIIALKTDGTTECSPTVMLRVVQRQ